MKLLNRTTRLPAALATSAVALLLISGCKPGDTHVADEQTLRALDAQWSRGAGERNLDATVAFYSDDARLLPPDAPLTQGKTAIRALWATLLQPTDNISWQATKVEVAASGDLGYVTGTYEFDSHDAQGKPIIELGKMVEVFRKQSDGTWKVSADIWNPDTPPPAPARP